MSLSFSYSFGYIPSFDPPVLTTTTESAYVTVKVYPLFYNKNIIEWVIPSSLGNCTFNVYKSSMDSGPWTKINPVPLVGTNFLEDPSTLDFSKFRETFYVVEARLPAPDNRYFKSTPTPWINPRSSLMEIRAREIQRREKILLSKFNGVDTLVYRRMYFGARCPNCYDQETEKVTKDHCLTCYGTSFTGGYFPGILTKIHFEVSPNSTQQSYQGKFETNQTTAWTVSYPSITPLDLLLRVHDFKMFRVGDMNATEIQTVQVRQLMQITELNKNSVEMNLAKDIVASKYTTPALTGSSATTKIGYII